MQLCVYQVLYQNAKTLSFDAAGCCIVYKKGTFTETLQTRYTIGNMI